MMRTLGLRTLLAGALAAATLACQPAAPRVSSAPAPDEVLAARILPPQAGQVPLWVNKPAYVALFEVVPGRGVSLLYPRSGMGFTQVRDVWVPMRFQSQRWVYQNDPTSAAYGYGAGYRQAGSRFANGIGGWNGGFAPATQPPRYLFLVASEDPIDIEQFQDGANATRQTLGLATFASFDVDETFEQIAYELLPYAADERWVTDVWIDWGFDWGMANGYANSAFLSSWQPVFCSDGLWRYGLWTSGFGFEQLPCTPMAWTQTPTFPTTPPPPPPAPGDSVAPPPAGGERRRADRSDEPSGEQQERRRADAELRAEAETRAQFERLQNEERRLRSTGALNDELRQRMHLRQRADAALRARLFDRSATGAVRRETRGSSAAGNVAAERARQIERRRDAELERAGASRAPAGERARPAARDAERRAEPRATRGTAESPRRERPARESSRPSAGSGSSGGSTERAAPVRPSASGSSGGSSGGSAGSSSSGGSSSGGSSGGRTRPSPPPR